MSTEEMFKVKQDLTPLANASLINQGFLRTILETQSKILAHIEGREQEQVIEGLYDRVNENICHAVEQHREKFPEVYLD
ncbi:hypothetical protein ACG2F4_04240 [Halalkalibaculum sp. DA3122]|uniref:hypothetical protein n=1 Tax=unclassified Halalkalibaculum TaxID=2964617 RepID=UPI0037553C67